MQPPVLPDDEILRLRALHECAILDTEPDQRFDRLTQLARHLFGTPIALVSLVDAERQWFKSRQGYEICETPRDVSFCGHAILGSDIFEVPDAYLDPRFADNPLVTGPPNIRFYAGAPLSTPEGYRIGTLCIVADQPRQLSAIERQSLRHLAACVEEVINQIALEPLVEAARLQQQHAKDQREIARLWGIASQITNGVVITDAQGRVEWINDGFTRIAGYTLDDLRGRKPGEVLQGEGTDLATVEIMRTALARQEPFEVEIVNYAKTRAPYWIRILCNPLRNASGKLEGFMAIQSDISAHKEAEQRLRETTRLLTNILENVPNMIFLKRATDLRFEFFNRAGETLLGRARAELLGRNDYDFFPKEQADFFFAKDRAVLAQDGVVDIPEETIETPHGTRVLYTRKLALRDDAGRPQYLLGISEDITERQRVERMKSEFVSTVSHELRTPLTTISGVLGLLAGGVLGELPEEAQDMVVLAEQNTQRLTCLINDLLDMEQLMLGKQRFDLQAQALTPLVAEAIRDNQAYADRRKVCLRLVESADDAMVEVDAQRLEQVLANLLSNAAKFSPAGGQVEIAVRVCNGMARVTVQDHGPGIPADFRERIFEKFSQADASDSRQKGGSGLGLAISRELIERMGGRIGFESVEGEGACFFFDLPVVSQP